MNELIIEYILNRISLKGSMMVCFDDRKMYHEDIINHLSRVFNLDGFMANGYLSTCVFEIDGDFSYSHWSFQKKLPEIKWGEGLWAQLDRQAEGRLNRYYAGIDPAMGDDATVMNFLVRERMGVQFIHIDMAPIVDLPIP